MGRYRIEATATSTASPERVWDLLGYVATWHEWGAWHDSGLESPGSPEPDGVGAIRRYRMRRRITRERVVAYEPGRRLAYDLLDGVPLADYHGEVTLRPVEGGGTSIHWRSTFDGTWPGSGLLWRFALGVFVRDTAKRLARAAER